MNADFTSAGTTSSRSASESTITQFLPPISATTRLRCRWPGASLRRPADDLQPDRPGAGERDRVHARVAHQRRADRPLAGQQRQRARRQRRTRAARARPRSAHAGACSAGLRTTALPVASPAATIPSGIATGKFHGEITATIPRGRQRSSLRSPGSWISSASPAGRSSSAIAAARVVLEEVDRLAHVGVGLAPRLGGLAHLERGDLQPPLAQPLRGARPAPRRAAAAVRRRQSRRAGEVERVVDVGLGRDRRLGHDPLRLAGIGRDQRAAGARVVADPHRDLDHRLGVERLQRARELRADRRPPQLQDRFVGEGLRQSMRGRPAAAPAALPAARRAPARTGTTRWRCSRAAAAPGRPCRPRGRRPGSRCARAGPGAAIAACSGSPSPRRTCSSRSCVGAAGQPVVGDRVRDRAQVVRGDRDAARAGRASSSRRVSSLEVRVGVGLALEHRRVPAVLRGLDELVVPVGALDEPDRQRRARARRVRSHSRIVSSVCGESRR